MSVTFTKVWPKQNPSVDADAVMHSTSLRTISPHYNFSHLYWEHFDFHFHQHFRYALKSTFDPTPMRVCYCGLPGRVYKYLTFGLTSSKKFCKDNTNNYGEYGPEIIRLSEQE